MSDFCWSSKLDLLLYDSNDVLCTLRIQVVLSNRRGGYKVDDADFYLINQKMEDQ